MPLNSTRGASSSKGFGFGSSGGKPYFVQYLIVAGGGGTETGYGCGGGGAGGVRTIASKTFQVTTKKIYTVTVGTGGNNQAPGTDSSFAGDLSTITSAGGAGSGYLDGGPAVGKNGGSGSGGSIPWQSTTTYAGGTGNVPNVSPAQGYPGGSSASQGIPNKGAGGGGGGASAAGGDASPGSAGPGGNGVASSISGSSVTYGGGGGGGGMGPGPSAGSGGTGGGGNGGQFPPPAGTGGTDGLGGGAGGAPWSQPSAATTGGTGIVIIRRLTADSTSASGGTVTTDGADTIHTFTGSGSFTA
jgi:hypothetical protein